MADTIDSQIHYMLAVEHLASARLELMEAYRLTYEPDRSLERAFEGIDNAMKAIINRVRA